MQERTNTHLPKAIEQTLAELDISGYKAAIQTGWDPSFMSKVLKGYYPMGLKRLSRLSERLRLSDKQRIRLAAAYAADQGRVVKPTRGCRCDTCLTLKEYAPELM